MASRLCALRHRLVIYYLNAFGASQTDACFKLALAIIGKKKECQWENHYLRIRLNQDMVAGIKTKHGELVTLLPSDALRKEKDCLALARRLLIHVATCLKVMSFHAAVGAPPTNRPRLIIASTIVALAELSTGGSFGAMGD